MNRLMRFAVLGVAGALAVHDDARASDWVFQRSYYSHADSPGYTAGIAPHSRSAYRKSYWHSRQYWSIRSTYRYNPVRIFNGQSYDTTIYRQYSYDVQY